MPAEDGCVRHILDKGKGMISLERDELAQAYEHAWTEYQMTWEHVDAELYDLCQRKAHTPRKDVFVKVAMINRVYDAGIQRSLGTAGEEHVAEVLSNMSNWVEMSLDTVSGTRLDNVLARELIGVHGHLAREIKEALGRWLPSFLSKYLHFHNPLFPIFDDRARTVLEKSTHNFADPVAKIAEPDKWHTDYFRFVKHFVSVYLRLEQIDLKTQLTVKGIDHMLWSQSR